MPVIPLLDDYSEKTVEWLVKKYIEVKAPSWSTNNAQHATVMLRFFGALTLHEICQPYVLRNLCIEYNASRDVAKATVTKQLRVLQAALRWAWKQTWIPGLPVMWLPGSDPPRDRIISAEEREKILKATETYPTQPHIRTFVYLTMCTNQYRQAIVDLTWKRVNFEDNVINFDVPDKGRVRVTMSPRLRRIMERAKEEKRKGCEHVVHFNGKPVRNVYYALQVFLDHFGFENITMNDLRRSRDPEAA